MIDLVSFLRERLDEDERVALEAKHELSGRWSYRDPELHPYRYSKVTDDAGEEIVTDSQYGAQPWWTLPHIARHDPARVLADVAAHRRILDMGQALLETLPNDPAAALMMTQAGEHILRHLAAVHADHPDYRAEWRPEPSG